jgi:GcrA cell cycle regulator
MSDVEIQLAAVYRSRQHKAAMTRSMESWSDWQIEIVAREWPLDQISAAQIGALVNKTRNAVIGKAHRLGLGGRRIGHPHSDSKAKPKPKLAKVRVIEMMKPPKPPRFIEKDVLLGGNPISIGQLNEYTCRAPAGYGADGVMVYCGNQTFPGKPFCEGHCAMFYTPSLPRSHRR